MKIVIAPHGTRGDVQPVLALSLALRDRGHAVRIAAPRNFGPWIQSFGVQFHPVGADIQALLDSSRERIDSLRWQIQHLAQEVIPTQFEILPGICRGADLIIGAGLQLAGASVAENCGAPYLFAVYCPAAIPSAYVAPAPVPWQTLPRWLNALAWWLMPPLGDLMLRKALNRGRRKLGLPPIRGPLQQILSAPGVVLAADPRLAPAPPDFPSTVSTTGAWVLPEAGSLEQHLQSFLASGSRPVYVGFGSMVTGHSGEVTRMVLEAGEIAGCRLILGSGWAGLGRLKTRLPEWCTTVGPTPHARLFPSLAGVVHHGGAGTTTCAAHAGVPQIIVPHLLDQFYWAHRVHTLGLGPPPLPMRRLSARRLATLLMAVMDDPGYRERARTLASQIMQNGAEAGVRVIEEYLAHF